MMSYLKNKIIFGEETNTLKILGYIRQQETTSQIEIVKKFSLSKAAVSDVVQKLISREYIQEVGMSESSKKGGRRRVLLKFNPLSGFIIGIDINISSADIAISDLNANIYDKKIVSFPRKSNPKKVIAKIIKAVDELLNTKPESSGELIGIGIAVPGIINYKTGTLDFADTLTGWEGISLSNIFEAHFNIPVLIENNVKAMTLAEYLLGVAKGIRDFVLLWIENGIGAGIMVDGNILRGVSSSAGEIGYNELGFLVSDKTKFPMLYSDQKDFGDILSEDAILEAYKKSSNNRNEISFNDVKDLLNKGDEKAKAIFYEVSQLIGIIGIMIVNMLNPAMIILGGTIPADNSQNVNEVQKFLHKNILSYPVQNVKVEAMKNKTDKVLLGAIGLILYELFE